MKFQRLTPDSGTLTATEVAAELRADARPHEDRPYLAVNMVVTVDGNITVGGRSGPIGNEADRELFHELRGQVDAVMVGAGTLRTERYGRIVRDDDRRARREDAGLAPNPLAIVVSAHLALDPGIPLLADPDSDVVIVTISEAEIDGVQANVEYIRTLPDPTTDAIPLAPALRQLRERGIQTVLCEGGSVLNASLLAEDLVDELFLVIASKVSAGIGPTILSGPELDPPVEMRLISALEAGGDLFLRYRIPA